MKIMGGCDPPTSTPEGVADELNCSEIPTLAGKGGVLIVSPIVDNGLLAIGNERGIVAGQISKFGEEAE